MIKESLKTKAWGNGPLEWLTTETDKIHAQLASLMNTWVTKKAESSSFATPEEYTIATELVLTEKTNMDKNYGQRKSEVLREYAKMK